MKKTIYALGRKTITNFTLILTLSILSIFFIITNIITKNTYYVLISIMLLIICALCLLVLFNWKITFFEDYFILPYVYNNDNLVEKKLKIEYSMLSNVEYIENTDKTRCIIDETRKPINTLEIQLTDNKIYKMRLDFFSKKQIDIILNSLNSYTHR